MNKTNKNMVWVTLYGHATGDLPLPKFRVRDHEGEPIIGKFYEEELSTVNKKDDTYRIEKVLRKKNGMALVKWLGYDSRSWIPIKDIKDIQ